MLASIKQISKSLNLKKLLNGSVIIMRSQSHALKPAFEESYIEERKVLVDGININYVKTGTGDHPVLLIPGVMGSIWTDFKPQIENLDKEKFTIIAWDPPGYGKSRPPERTFSEQYFRRDGTWARNLMATLGYDQFSCIAWSAGGASSFFLAGQYPECIKKLIVIGTNSHLNPKKFEFLERLRNPDSWSEQMKAPLLAIYGDEYFKKLCGGWIDIMKSIIEKNNGNMCDDYLPKITCPTLIVYGEKDVIISREHQDYLKANIKNSRLVFFKHGAHNVHLRYANEFNALVEKFLNE